MEALAGGGGELLRRRGERADGVLQGNRTLTREEGANMHAAAAPPRRHFRRNQEVEVNAERREKLEINSPPGCTGQ